MVERGRWFQAPRGLTDRRCDRRTHRWSARGSAQVSAGWMGLAVPGSVGSVPSRGAAMFGEADPVGPKARRVCSAVVTTVRTPATQAPRSAAPTVHRPAAKHRVAFQGAGKAEGPREARSPAADRRPHSPERPNGDLPSPSMPCRPMPLASHQRAHPPAIRQWSDLPLSAPCASSESGSDRCLPPRQARCHRGRGPASLAWRSRAPSKRGVACLIFP